MNINELLESLSPNERRILPFIKHSFEEIIEKSGLDETSVLRSLEFLENKKILKLKIEKKKVIDLGVNGILYQRKGLPERNLLIVLEKGPLNLNDAKKQSKLSDNEFQAALGALKKKAMIEIKNGKILLTANKEEITKKSLEEQFLEALPLEYDKLKPEQLHALKSLQNRKEIIEIKDERLVSWELTDIGKEIIKQDLVKAQELIEQLTPEMIKTSSWKGKKFRRYDILSKVPEIYGGKRHFVNQAIDNARKIWTELGFKEMTGSLTQTGFWNFDALFTAQDHPVREIQDTFYIKDIKGKLPDKKITNAVKQSHEKGVEGSKGWQYSWHEDEAKRVILRTHTTCLSAQTLAKLGKDNLKEIPAKFFSVGKCFRNETVDASHGFEFNQTEGIVIDENANFKHLLGYLKEFLNKMGYEKIRFRPHYFPYTEPSVEADVWNEKIGKWVEVLGAGIFRPEVTQPLLGKPITVLAWGPGFDRMLMKFYEIVDFREMYENNLNKLRKIKFWVK